MLLYRTEMPRLIPVLVIAGICLVRTNAFALVGIDDYTVLMLHFNGDDGSTEFGDSSFKDHTVTTFGSAQVDAGQKKLGTGSAYFDGNSGYLSIPDSADWDLNNGDFTIDFWVRFNGFNIQSNPIIGQFENPQNSWLVDYNKNTGKFYFWDYESSALITQYYYYSVGGTDFKVNTWYHIAIVRDGSNCYFFENGISQPVGVDFAWGTSKNLSGNLYLGFRTDINNYLSGWLDELRVSKGVARWSSNFSPPTTEYEPIPEPQTLILCSLGLLGMILKKIS